MKSIIDLWVAEAIKARLLVQRFIFLLLLTGALLIFAQVIIAKTDPNLAPYIQLQLSLPYFIQMLLSQIFGAGTNSIFGMIIVSIFSAQLVYTEYQNDTWKSIIPRQRDRQSFVIAKILFMTSFFALILFIILPVLQCLSLIASALNSTPMLIAHVPPQITDLQIIYSNLDQYLTPLNDISTLIPYMAQIMLLALAIWIRMVFWGVIAMLFTYILRSSLIAVIGTILLSFAQLILPGLSFARPLAAWLPSLHIDYAVLRLSGGTGTVGNLAIFPSDHGINESLLISILGVALNIMMTILVFRKQDIGDK